MDFLVQNLAQDYLDILEYQKRKFPFWWHLCVYKLRDIDGQMKKIRSLMKEDQFLRGGGKISNRRLLLIEKAREVPIEEILEMNSRHFAKCPFHEDRTPSLYSKSNFAYCFGCVWHGDGIKLTQELYGLSFVEAVRRLAG
jgi:hypothetical protein